MKWARAPIWGLLLFGLALAGLVLVGSVVGAVIYGDIALVNRRGLLDSTVMTLVVLGVFVAFGVPRALLTMRRLASLTRRLSGEWCDVEITEPYPAQRASEGRPGSWSWSLGALVQPATWRDVAWMLVAPVVGAPLLLLPLAAPALLGWYWASWTGTAAFQYHPSKAPVLAALAVATVGSWVAGPWLLKVYGLLARSLLGPTLQSELSQRVQHLATTRSESLDSSASELRRIERDLHDGAQARLVSLGMTLGALEGVIGKDEQAARALLVEAQGSSSRALAELRDLVRGIHPPVLADRGLVDAVRALALDSPLPIEVVAEVGGRPPAPVESAVYFAVSELLANVSKHAGATRATVELQHREGSLHVRVRDNGHGGADPNRGTGLHGIERRLAAFDGYMVVLSPIGGPTLVDLEVPCELSLPRISSS